MDNISFADIAYNDNQHIEDKHVGKHIKCEEDQALFQLDKVFYKLTCGVSRHHPLTLFLDDFDLIKKNFEAILNNLETFISETESEIRENLRELNPGISSNAYISYETPSISDYFCDLGIKYYSKTDKETYIADVGSSFPSGTDAVYVFNDTRYFGNMCVVTNCNNQLLFHEAEKVIMKIATGTKKINFQASYDKSNVPITTNIEKQDIKDIKDDIQLNIRVYIMHHLKATFSENEGSMNIKVMNIL